MAHGEPGSLAPAVSVLFGPLRPVNPMGWMGGMYSTVKPILATAGRRFAAVRNVPDFQEPSFCCTAPSERGKNSYQLPTPARRRSTRRGNLGVNVSVLEIGASATISASSGELAWLKRTRA